MLGAKHEFSSIAGKPDLAARGACLEEPKGMFAGKRKRPLVGSLLVEPDGDIDHVVSDAVIGTSLIARNGIWPVESGEAHDHVKEPSAQFWRSECRVIAWVRL